MFLDKYTERGTKSNRERKNGSTTTDTDTDQQLERYIKTHLTPAELHQKWRAFAEKSKAVAWRFLKEEFFAFEKRRDIIKRKLVRSNYKKSLLDDIDACWQLPALYLASDRSNIEKSKFTRNPCICASILSPRPEVMFHSKYSSTA